MQSRSVLPSCRRTLDCAPHILRGERHGNFGNVEWRKRIQHTVVDRRRNGNVGSFGAAFCAERIERTRRFGAIECQLWHPVGTGQGVIKEGTVQWLPVLVVDNLLAEYLTEAERNPADCLAFQQQRVESASAIVNE